MALEDLSGSKQMIGSKPTAQIWALVSVARTLYPDATQLVLPLPKNEVKYVKG